MSRPLRVVHLPTLVGNNAPILAEAERALGLDSRAVTLHQSPFSFAADEVVFAPGDGPLTKERKRWGLLARLVREADVIHCNFGRCLMPVLDDPPPARWSWRYELRAAVCRLFERLDLRLLRLAGKGIVVTYQGDDIRQGEHSRETFEYSIAQEVGPEYYDLRVDARKRRRATAFDQQAHRIFALNPDLLHVLPERASFLPYASVDPAAWEPVGVSQAERPLKVLHAPSHRGAKGTHHVLEAVRTLQAEGVPLELLLVEGLSHAEARAMYREADVLVDQVLAGFYGGLAVELMALAKPVVAYLRDPDLAFLPPEMRAQLPVVSATPHDLVDVLRKLATTPRAELVERGQRGRAFVERWHDPHRIAAQLAEVYRSIMTERRAARGRG